VLIKTESRLAVADFADEIYGSLEEREFLASEFVRRWNAFEGGGVVTDLLDACKRMLGAMSCDELNNGRVWDDDLRKEVKEKAEQAIAKAEAGK